MKPFHYNQDPLYNAAASILQGDLCEAADDFYRLPGHVINNELYVAVKNLNSIQSSLRNGNDFDVSSFKSVITSLNAIAKQAKSFKADEKVPVSYQYTAV